MRILITSDNHLGFKEGDLIRGDDSFNTFEEILNLSISEDVDFLIQGGDLFDSNKPSRNTLNKTFKSLKKYCLGNKKNFISNIPLNHDNPYLNIGLPILAIHGNHDDPSGHNYVSAMDILESSGYVNYFGKVKDVDNIEVTPILIKKDNFKIALYGIGYIKDRRIYKTFSSNKVNFIRPNEPGNFYKILVVHQNRAFRHEEYLPEDFIDPFFDLVIYGHEHASEHVNHRNFQVIQVGSSVRTSLVPFESGNKYAYILDLSKDNTISRHQLKTVRPLHIQHLNITNKEDEENAIRKVESFLNNQNKGSINDMLPLFRLKIDLGEGLSINKHEIMKLIEPKIANPNDLIKIVRKKNNEDKQKYTLKQRGEIFEMFLSILNNQNLSTFIPVKVVDGLKEFVEKDSKDAFIASFNSYMEQIMNHVDYCNTDTQNIENVIKHARDMIIINESVEEGSDCDDAKRLKTHEKDIKDFLDGISLDEDDLDDIIDDKENIKN